MQNLENSILFIYMGHTTRPTCSFCLFNIISSFRHIGTMHPLSKLLKLLVASIRARSFFTFYPMGPICPTGRRGGFFGKKPPHPMMLTLIIRPWQVVPQVVLKIFAPKSQLDTNEVFWIFRGGTSQKKKRALRLVARWKLLSIFKASSKIFKSNLHQNSLPTKQSQPCPVQHASCMQQAS